VVIGYEQSEQLDVEPAKYVSVRPTAGLREWLEQRRLKRDQRREAAQAAGVY
jgi:hypothetical protein